LASWANQSDAALVKHTNLALLRHDPERDPSVVVRDAALGTLRPPPVSRRRLRTRTLPGLGEDADSSRASLVPISDQEFAAVDELLAQSLDGFDLPAD
jgi:hypothetical protein